MRLIRLTNAVASYDLMVVVRGEEGAQSEPLHIVLRVSGPSPMSKRVDAIKTKLGT